MAAAEVRLTKALYPRLVAEVGLLWDLMVTESARISGVDSGQLAKVPSRSPPQRAHRRRAWPRRRPSPPQTPRPFVTRCPSTGR